MRGRGGRARRGGAGALGRGWSTIRGKARSAEVGAARVKAGKEKVEADAGSLPSGTVDAISLSEVTFLAPPPRPSLARLRAGPSETGPAPSRLDGH